MKNKYLFNFLIISVILLSSCKRINKPVNENAINEVKVTQVTKLTKQDLQVEVVKDKVITETKEKHIIKKEEKNSPIIKQVIDETVTKPNKPSKKIVVKEMENTFFKLSGAIKLDTSKVNDKTISKKNIVVYFVPKIKEKFDLPVKDFVINTRNKRFVPSVMVVPVGSNVVFPNQDRILHNVFSVSKIAPFDLGLYSAGKQKQVNFTKPGIAYINCNVHHSMQADILVVDTPFYINANDKGEYVLNNLPTIDGTLFIWHPRALLQKIPITSSDNIQKINYNLKITREKIPQHLNKFGQPYIKLRK